MTTKPLAQEFLFQRIRELLPPQYSLADTISEILHVSNDSAYRRIRNETPLLLEEAKLLCDHFKLSLDQLFQVNNNSVMFHRIILDSSENSFENYLKGILQQLKGATELAQTEIIYLTKDFPLFHMFAYEPFYSFRYFFWMKTILRHPDFQEIDFSFSLLPAHILSLGQEIIKLYNRVASTEIWNTECVNSTILQIEYYKDAGFFSSASDIRAIYDSAEETLNHIKIQAENGVKFSPGESSGMKKKNFRFFNNRIVLGDNTIILLNEQGKTVYLNYEVLNYMITRDTGFCNQAHLEMENLMKRSTLISETSERQRNIFFGILLGKIRDRKKNL
jgi:hypothetical protein